MEDILNEIHRSLIKIEDPNKLVRKRNLQNIQNVLQTKYPLPIEKPNLNQREVCTLWTDKLHSPLLRCLRDESERVREISAEIILFIFGHMANSSPMTLSYVVPVLKQRLAHQPEDEAIEPSEEVRLILLKILNKILELSGPESSQDMKLHLDDFIQIIGTCIGDSFADIKELACNDVHLLAKALPKDFHFTAEKLINPLARSMTHQQKKVRIASIKATGCVIHNSGFDQLQLVASHLAQRLFDLVPMVRLSVSKVAGDLLMNWRCGYSSCSLLIPLLLTSLEDETPMVREECWTLWCDAGKKWVLEQAKHDNKLKEQMDFQGAADPPVHYPKDIQRPHFGCRKYISKVIHKLLPALKNDLGDWLVETRIKTSQLVYILICHMEETSVITQHSDSLIALFFHGVKDSESVVIKNMCRSARIYGYFVPPKTWIPMISQRLLAQALDTDLLILSHIIIGSDPQLLRGNIEDLAMTLQDDSVSLTLNDSHLDSLLECAKAILEVSKKDCKSISGYLFKIGITVDGLSLSNELQESANAFIDNLASVLEISRLDLFKQELGPALKTMKLECEDWTANSFRVNIFSKLLNRSGTAAGFYPDLIISIFHDVLNKEVEPELKLKMFLTLSKLLYDVKNTLDSQNDFKQFVLKLVTELISPALKWKSGRKSEAVRIAATSSLWSVFVSGSLDSKDLWSSGLASKLIPSMNRLLEDDSIKIRVFICQSFKHMFDQSQTLIPMEYLVKISTEIMKRLDDVNDEVRLSCLDALSAVVQCLPHGNNVQLEHHMKGVYTKLLLHMDDSNESIRNAALETLRITGVTCPKLLVSMTNKALEKHVHKDHCHQLVNHLHNLKV